MSRNKAKGTAAESAVRDYLRAHGFEHCERLAASGAKDRGDLTGMPGYCVEVKATTRIDLGEFFGEAETEARNCGPGIVPLLVIKRRLKPVARWYCVTALEDQAALLLAADGRGRVGA